MGKGCVVLPPTNQAWVELMRSQPERFLMSHNREYADSKAIMMECECSQSTAYKLGLIAVKAYRAAHPRVKPEAVKADSENGGSGVVGSDGASL